MMATFKLVFLVSFALFLVFILTDIAEGYPSSKPSTTTNDKRKIKVKQVKGNFGATCKLRCKIPYKTAEVVWFKDGLLLNITKLYKIKRRSKLELLKISNMTLQYCGLYECLVKSRKQGAWRIVLSDGKNVRCRSKREVPVCGKAAIAKFSTCATAQFPGCKSFAGQPKHIKTAVFIDKGKPLVQIGWERPDNGYNDLWGYQVHIIGLAGNVGHQKCIQLNIKEGDTFWTFHEVEFDAEYKLMLQSMPSNERPFEKRVYVKDKCEFKEFKLQPCCCLFSKVNSTVDVDYGMISLSWSIHCAEKSIEIKRFRVAWTNLQKPEKCSGLQIVQRAVSESSRSNYSILLSKECQQHNYSIRILGIHDSNRTTIPVKVIVHYPQKIAVVAGTTSVGQRGDSTKIFVAVAGVLFGLALVALFFIYKYCFTKVVYKLPNPSQPPAGPGFNRSESRSGEPLLDDGLKRVFLMSARCCSKCNWVLHCLGELLKSTGLVEVRTDVWFENDISSSVLRWYEEEIREANCVVVLASSKMAKWNQRRNVPNRTDTDDLLDITAQLNLICGEITRDPHTPKFIPAYFKYNGETNDIPDFLSSRFAHKLPGDLNRLVYHVLNIEAIQPYRTRPIVVLGGKDHPFELRKLDLLRAIDEAEEWHQGLPESENNNTSSVA